MRTVGVALAVFAIGAGLGWNFAGRLLGGGTQPEPMVAAVRFEDSRPEAIPATERYQAVLPTSPAPMQPEDRRAYQSDMAVRPSDEERRLAEALQWAERYRRRQEMSVQNVIARQVQEEKIRLAAAEAQRWAEVGTHANRIKQPPIQMEQLIAEQGQQHGARSVAEGSKVASAAGSVVGGMASANVEPAATRVRHGRCENCGYRPVRKHARVAKRVRVARHARGRRTSYEAAAFMCPLRWLETALMGERHRGHRARRHTWLG